MKFLSFILYIPSMRVITSCYLILAMALSSAMAAKSNPYCSGKQFATTTANCGKFEFNKLKTSGQCTDSSKKTEGKFRGIKLSNCTTQVPFFFLLIVYTKLLVAVSMILANYQVKKLMVVQLKWRNSSPMCKEHKLLLSNQCNLITPHYFYVFTRFENGNTVMGYAVSLLLIKGPFFFIIIIVILILYMCRLLKNWVIVAVIHGNTLSASTAV
jgi:hypothetical protein